MSSLFNNLSLSLLITSARHISLTACGLFCSCITSEMFLSFSKRHLAQERPQRFPKHEALAGPITAPFNFIISMEKTAGAAAGTERAGCAAPVSDRREIHIDFPYDLINEWNFHFTDISRAQNIPAQSFSKINQAILEFQ